jgi:NAD(P)-dependent dehydrogenase (short-subunit alcohol dehydrogenase family)
MQAKLADSGFRDWTPDRLPDLAGRTYLITGGNSGIGLEAAKMLAAAGGDIVIACRNPQKAQQAVAEIDAAGPGSVDSVTLDLASLASVRSAAREIHERWDSLDALINNAGIMQTPPTTTEDGFELQFGTNHLGHFLLAGLLFDLVEKAAGRIVVVSSIAHKLGRIDFDDLMVTRRYTPSRAYTQSKLANLMFALELDRRLRAAGSPVACIACHPGYSNTHLQSTGPTGVLNALYKFLNPLVAQPAYNGAIPTVLAAAGEEALPGAYYGPQSLGDARGRVSDARVAARARNERDAARLWRESEKLVGYEWTIDRQ